MYSRYLVTGATGFLGRAIVKELADRGDRVSALVMEGDKLAALLPPGTDVFYGDVRDRDSMLDFFASGEGEFCVVHCAGIVSIASKPGKRLYEVNVEGTRNVVRLCVERGAAKLVYVSSVHALREAPKGTPTAEASSFDPALVDGDYAKSKAMATRLVLEAAKTGLNVSVVHPSGMIGPGDVLRGNMTEMFAAFWNGRLPAGVLGGYDFADVRDVAAGTVACADSGGAGECYILSGHYVTVRRLLKLAGKAAGRRPPFLYIPPALAIPAARLHETAAARKGKKPFFTPYSVRVLGTNGKFTHEKASRELGYAPRPVEQTVAETESWMREHGMLRTSPRRVRCARRNFSIE